MTEEEIRIGKYYVANLHSRFFVVVKVLRVTESRFTAAKYRSISVFYLLNLTNKKQTKCTSSSKFIRYATKEEIKTGVVDTEIV